MESAGIAEDANGDQMLAEQLASAWGRLQSLRDDPPLEEVMNDPELREKLAEGDSIGLLSDPRFARLLQAFEGGAESSPPAGSGYEFPQATTGGQPADREPGAIYRWRDAEGQLHMSDSPPPQPSGH